MGKVIDIKQEIPNELLLLVGRMTDLIKDDRVDRLFLCASIQTVDDETEIMYEWKGDSTMSKIIGMIEYAKLMMMEGR